MTEEALRKQFADTADSYLGTIEGSSSHKEIVDLYNSHSPLARGYTLKYTDPWCAGFVSAMAVKCNLTDIIPTEVGCGQMISLFQELGRWQENDAFVPAVGDVIFYDWDDDGIDDCKGYPSHVGIVAAVFENTIRVIEGNRYNAVLYREIPVDWMYIRGFGIPDFASKSDCAAASQGYPLEQFIRDIQRVTGSMVDGIAGPETIRNTPTVYRWWNSTHRVVKFVQQRLTVLGYDPTWIDGIFGQRTAAAVKAFQRDHGCIQDGVITGRDKTWRKLLGME